MKLTNKKIFVIAIIISVLLISFIIIGINNNLLTFNKYNNSIKKLEELPEFSYMVYSNKNGIKLTATAVDTNGIKEIIYPNNNTILDCNGKQQIVIDYEIEKEKDYIFTVKNENDEIKEYTVRINNLDDYIKINIMSEQELGTQAKINITYGVEGRTNQYVIGKNNTSWVNYNNEINIDSYTIINNRWGNADYTTTVKARTVDRAGNIIEIEKEITCLDIEPANAPTIAATSNNKFPVLTQNGVEIEIDITEISFDQRNDITNYYSVNGGRDWYIYNSTSQLNDLVGNGIILAKSVKNISGLESISPKGNYSKKLAAGSVGPLAYDGDDSTSESNASGGPWKIKVDSSAYGKTIYIKSSLSTSYGGNKYFILKDSQVVGLGLASSANYTVPNNAEWLVFSRGWASYSWIYEIRVLNDIS